MSRADFVQMQATSIAGSGSGAVTMSAYNNSPTFTQTFGSSARLVKYSIVDQTNGYAERGYGSIAGNVLTRSKVRQTWNGTIVSVGGSTFAFATSPAAGQITVDLGPTSDGFMEPPPAIQTTVGSDIWKGYEISGQIGTSSNYSAGAAMGTANEYYVPYLNNISGTVSGFALQIATAGTSGNGIKAALYEVGADGLPGPCITQFNALPANATGLITDTTPGTWGVNAGPISPAPGWFYIGLMTNDPAVALASTSLSNWLARGPLGSNTGYGQASCAFKAAQNSYATGLPTGTPAGTYSLVTANNSVKMPILGLKVGN